MSTPFETHATAQHALAALHDALAGLEHRCIELTAAALRFAVDDVTTLTAGLDDDTAVLADRHAAAAAALAAARAEGLDLSLLSPSRDEVVAYARRVHDVQQDTRAILERARSFTGAHARALVGGPPPAVGYTRRAMAATSSLSSIAGALQTARV